MKDKLTEARMVIANASGVMFALSAFLQLREPTAAEILLDKAKKLDHYLEPHVDAN